MFSRNLYPVSQFADLAAFQSATGYTNAVTVATYTYTGSGAGLFQVTAPMFPAHSFSFGGCYDAGSVSGEYERCRTAFYFLGAMSDVQIYSSPTLLSAAAVQNIYQPTACLAWTWGLDGKSPCTACPAGQSSPAGAQTSLECFAHVACALCPANSFKATTGPEPCDPCRSNATSGAGSTLASLASATRASLKATRSACGARPTRTRHRQGLLRATTAPRFHRLQPAPCQPSPACATSATRSPAERARRARRARTAEGGQT